MTAPDNSFDPWTSSAAEALRARSQVSANAPDPLSQHEAAQTVIKLRDVFDGDAGGCAVLEAVKLCLLHQLLPPQWLADAFVPRHANVVEAAVKDWNDPKAFGCYWPKGTHLAAERKRRRLKRLINAAVWRIRADQPDRSINRDLFEEISEDRAIDACGSEVEKLYYQGLAEGMPNPLDARTPRVAILRKTEKV